MLASYSTTMMAWLEGMFGPPRTTVGACQTATGRQAQDRQHEGLPWRAMALEAIALPFVQYQAEPVGRLPDGRR